MAKQNASANARSKYSRPSCACSKMIATCLMIFAGMPDKLETPAASANSCEMVRGSGMKGKLSTRARASLYVPRASK